MAIRKILKNSAIKTPDNSGNLNLNEDCNGQKMNFIISGTPPDLIAIKLDKNFKNEDIFKGENFECKRADYILISEEKKKCMFFELKKCYNHCNHKKDVRRQLEGARCFFVYLKEICKTFLGKTELSGFDELFFVATNSVDDSTQRPTNWHRTKNQTPPTSANSAKVIKGSPIAFNNLK